MDAQCGCIWRTVNSSVKRTARVALSLTHTHTSVAFVNENVWLNIVVNKPLSRDENETRRNVNAGHVTMTIIKYILQYRWRIKTRLNVVYKIKTMLKWLGHPSYLTFELKKKRSNAVVTFPGN